jgi:hypothetical protein
MPYIAHLESIVQIICAYNTIFKPVAQKDKSLDQILGQLIWKFKYASCPNAIAVAITQ